MVYLLFYFQQGHIAKSHKIKEIYPPERENKVSSSEINHIIYIKTNFMQTFSTY